MHLNEEGRLSAAGKRWDGEPELRAELLAETGRGREKTDLLGDVRKGVFWRQGSGGLLQIAQALHVFCHLEDIVGPNARSAGGCVDVVEMRHPWSCRQEKQQAAARGGGGRMHSSMATRGGGSTHPREERLL